MKKTIYILNAFIFAISLTLVSCNQRNSESSEIADSGNHTHEHDMKVVLNESKKEISHYTCPMNSEIHEKKPGECPLCGMKLVPVYKGENKKK